MARPKKFRIPIEEVTQSDNARKVAGHVAEIEFFRKQIADLQEHIADVYDAADEEGFDKKFIRLAVARRAKDPDAAKAVEAGVDTYEEAIDLGFSSRARVENLEHDADGVIIEQGPADRSAGGVALPADTQSTAASQERAQTATGVGTGGDNLGPASRSSAEAKTGVPAERETASDDQGEAPGDGRSQHNSGVRVDAVDTFPIRQDEPVDAAVDGPQTVDGRRNSEPVRGQSGAKPDSAGAPAAEGGGAGASASSAVPKLKMNPEFFNAPHPACQRPSFCGGNSNLALCEDCKVAAGRASANDDFAQVEMRGTIN